jgi:mono/diheme cytochrome c family protein
VTLAVLVLSGVFADATPGSDVANPVPFTVSSVDAGRNLYLASCAACHGAVSLKACGQPVQPGVCR